MGMRLGTGLRGTEGEVVLQLVCMFPWSEWFVGSQRVPAGVWDKQCVGGRKFGRGRSSPMIRWMWVQDVGEEATAGNLLQSWDKTGGLISRNRGRLEICN